LRRQIVAYREVDHLCAAATVEVPGRPRAIDALIQHPELLNTLRSLVRHDGNLAETAAELCIHRNTL
ncbi:MAG TPA: sugar diacid utilization regulator, partial [Propionibacteriaceae bacterium]|nr:sugar diacid utilization regulator [Propionibacteriaceae bacterium]